MKNIIETTVQVTEETAKAKPYTLKPLTGEHIFPMVSIVRKIGLKELKSCISEDTITQIVSFFAGGMKGAEKEDTEKKEKSEEEIYAAIGVTVLPTVLDVAEVLFANIEKAEADIFKFLASVSDLSVKEIRELPILDVFEMIVDVVKKEEFKDFFKVFSKLFN